ncbi:MAG TPA: Maf family protein, partial [Solirubrobacterales bacterium]|nr:Maf family protein [Solirubrobacterales bacterium]
MRAAREIGIGPQPAVVLASGSPQRKEILRKLGIEFEVVVPGVEELTGGEPEYEVLENARMKARAVEAGDGALVIACDTDVVLDGKALGKPRDEVEAREYLNRMSGRAHEVLSGLVVLEGGEERSGLERTSVVFKQ